MKKVIVITGATDGIGRELAKLLSKDYVLALCGRSREKMDSLLKELSNAEIYQECFDITDDNKRHNFCEHVKEKYGTVLKCHKNDEANFCWKLP